MVLVPTDFQSLWEKNGSRKVFVAVVMSVVDLGRGRNAMEGKPVRWPNELSRDLRCLGRSTPHQSRAVAVSEGLGERGTELE